ncbi:lamin tail domain-containing protein [Algoriphagus sp. oki45]|uniref:lamin tail domain-containing protein n=1 Tax=Algoriphagus sp. oki45 TaxID=3067294 RepID=UPI0027E78BD1|nr:lamin tail domain-containing protein [Algoriphagus sp. oki45]
MNRKAVLVFFEIFLALIRPEFVFTQTQSFESPFQIQSFPEEFLPGWWGNEVRSTSARIFRSGSAGREGSGALAVQPISTFNGVLWVRLSTEGLSDPKVSFWARSLRNGTGSRPAVVYYSWGKSLNGEYEGRTRLGEENEFGNEDQEFRRYILDLPEEMRSETEFFLKLDIEYGPGSGSAARWLMDDFDFGVIVVDTDPPGIDWVKGYSATELLLGFDEPVDPGFAQIPLAYTLEGENPERVSLLNDSTAILAFSQTLEEGRSYEIGVRSIPDLEGNFLQDTMIAFSFFDPTAFELKSLVINELMPAPRNDQDLPNVEYIELFNPGEKEWRLGGLVLSNSRTSAILPEYWMPPGGYLLLCPANQASLLQPFGEVLAIGSWPTLLNSGDQVSLKSTGELLVDELSYTTASWGGSEFSGGGYSLEVINPSILCGNSNFLLPSQSPQRGTPGELNSVFDPDFGGEMPMISRGYFLDSMQIFIELSYPILSVFGPGNVWLSPEVGIDSAFLISGKEIRVYLNRPIEEGVVLSISLTGLQNCLGSELPELGPISLVWPSQVQKGDLILNELLFDPLPGEPKFVEIRNTTQKYLNLEGWALGNRSSDGQVAQLRFFGERGLFLPPEGYLAISTDSTRLKITYPKSASGRMLQISSLPSYPISGGTVVLVRPDGEVEEEFRYSSSLHHPLLRNSKGVSLERISKIPAAATSENWQSASEGEDYATPGRRNSQDIEPKDLESVITIDPKVFDPEGSFGPSFTTISYLLDQPGWLGTFRIYTSGGQLVETLGQNQLLGREGIFVWDGTDAEGRRVRPGYYVLLTELYNLSGELIVIKKTVVVGIKL